MRIPYLAAGMLLAAAAVTAAAPHGQAAEWQPTRPIELIVPSAAGGGLDLLARTLQSVIAEAQLSPEPITVLNKPGGSSTVGLAYINEHPGDGHYVCVQALALVTNSITGQSEMSVADVTPLAQLMTEQIMFSVPAESPIKTGADLIKMLKENPDSVSIGVSSSPGGQSHDAAALLARAVGADPKALKVVFFDSGGEAMTALLGNHITVAVTPAGVVLGPKQAGQLRIVGIPAESRVGGDLADVATWKEQGADYTFSTWRVLVGPKGMPPEQVAWWNDVIAKATARPEWKEAVERNLWTADYKNSEQAAAFLASEKERLTALLTEIGLAQQ